MKILIGSPIHVTKDYCIERWLENVSRLEYPADLMLVDNSPGKNYYSKVKRYCIKHSLIPSKDKNKKIIIKHVEINQELKEPARSHLSIEVSQETIRQEVLKRNYDAWFSWECDQLIPYDALNNLVYHMQKTGCMMIVHNSWRRINPNDFEADMGVTLITRNALKIARILPVKNGKVSQDPKDMYNGNHISVKEKVLQGGGNYIDAYGIVDPIYHLSN